MNKVILIGRLVRDPDYRTAQSDNATLIATFTIAVNRSYKTQNGDQADFIRCVIMGRRAEGMQKCSVSKGTKLVIEGEWRTGSYTNRDGEKVYTNDCYVNNFEFAESKSAQQAAESPAPMQQPTPQPTPQMQIPQPQMQSSPQQMQPQPAYNQQPNAQPQMQQTYQQNNYNRAAQAQNQQFAQQQPVQQAYNQQPLNSNSFMDIPDGLDEEIPFQ